jgi:hypothetical protein
MVAGNQQAIERFVQYPGTLRILTNPHVAALIQDPELEKAAEKKNILPLLQNKHVVAASHDPRLLEQLKEFDLTGALDYALEPPKTTRYSSGPKLTVPASLNSHRAKAHATNTSSQSITTPGNAN